MAVRRRSAENEEGWSDGKRKRLVGLELGEGKRVAIYEEIEIGKKELRVGVISVGTPFWEWAVPAIGNLVWIWSSCSQGIAVKRVGLDVWLQSETSLSALPSVDVVLFEGPGPRASHAIWNGTSNTATNVIVWFDPCYRCRPPVSKSSDWKVEVVVLRHADLGGITTATTHFRIARRLLDARTSTIQAFRKWPSDTAPVGLVGSSLARVIDPTLPGRSCKAPLPFESNPCEGLLDMAKRDAFLKLPSVFTRSTGGHVLRQLSAKELLMAMDMPAVVVKAYGKKFHEKWATELKVPYKARFEILRGLRDLFQGVLPKKINPSSATTNSGGSVREDEASGGGGGEKKRARLCCSTEHQGGKDHVDESPMVLLVSTKGQRVSSLSHLKAAKADDAAVPTLLWDNRCRRGSPVMDANASDNLGGNSTLAAWARLLHALRVGALKNWKRRVASSFWKWWSLNGQLRVTQDPRMHQCDAEAPGLAALSHAVDASWWEWDRGSAPFFWRFPREWITLVCNGLPPRFTGTPPHYVRVQRPPKDPGLRALEKEKVSTIRQRGYVAARHDILALLNFFSVSKGEADIRMVYDGTASGLNSVLFAPWFSLTTLDGMLRSVGPGTFSADNDYGEMFHNFWLHPDLQKYCGIDLSGLFPEEVSSRQDGRLWEAWTRCAMGLRPSPYQAVQTGLQLKQLALGDRRDVSNVFRWAKVRLNLPGSTGYDPTLPWVSKVRKDGLTLAADVHQFVDDLRETGPTEEETWRAGSRVA